MSDNKHLIFVYGTLRSDCGGNVRGEYKGADVISGTIYDLGWYPETPFEAGIVKTVEWYLANRPWIDDVVSGEYQQYYKDRYEKQLPGTK